MKNFAMLLAIFLPLFAIKAESQFDSGYRIRVSNTYRRTMRDIRNKCKDKFWKQRCRSRHYKKLEDQEIPKLAAELTELVVTRYHIELEIHYSCPGKEFNENLRRSAQRKEDAGAYRDRVENILDSVDGDLTISGLAKRHLGDYEGTIAETYANLYEFKKLLEEDIEELKRSGCYKK